VADSAEIASRFRPLPRYLPGQWPGAEPNVLRLGLADSAFTSEPITGIAQARVRRLTLGPACQGVRLWPHAPSQPGGEWPVINPKA
jgi:hypothetical protein